jgi:hypothetical protein
VRLRRPLTALLFSFLLVVPLSTTTYAADSPPIEKGLLITPLRQFLAADAGEILHSSFTFANLTTEPLTVSASVKEFSVTDYVYDYTFQNPHNDWLHLEKTSVTLQPQQSSTIRYTVAVPAKSAPGGHYYTLFASANLSSQGLNSVIQAADLVYLTVKGKLTTVSHLQSSSIDWLSFGHNISYRLRPVNTGNVYSFVYVSGQLHGLFVKPPATSGAHLLMPGKVRDLNDSIPAPILPGVYQATYGYKTEGGWIVQESHWVVFIPPWSIAFLFAVLLVVGKLWTRKKRTNTDGTPVEDNEES